MGTGHSRPTILLRRISIRRPNTSCPAHLPSRSPGENSILLPGDPAVSVAALKAHSDPDLGVVGSGQLVRSLLAADMIDRYLLLIHPLVLGQGRRLFDERGPSVEFELVDSVATSTGVIIATYQRR
jgi:dihydrofolate reductase